MAIRKDKKRFAVVENLDHTSRSGEILDVEGQLWRVLEWTDRIECERVVSQGTDADHPVVSPDSKPSAKTGIAGPTHIVAVSAQGPSLVTLTQYHWSSSGSMTMLEVVSPVLQR